MRSRLPIVLPLVVAATAARAEADLELGRRVFVELAEPACALCHTLADAGATGDIGPNLDELQPAEERVRAAVTEGLEVMPAFGDQLDEEQIEAVARYVATVAGRR